MIDIIQKGYQHHDYATSFDEQGETISLPNSQGWLLKRPIKDTPFYDGMGCYPLFCCREWKNLETDLITLQQQLITITLVTDPFGDHGGQQNLQQCFPDLCLPFKEHYVIDLSREPGDFISSHHRRYGRKASKNCDIEHCSQPEELVKDWTMLYQNLINHRDIEGFLRFSPEIFSQQLAVPGMQAFRARQGLETLGMTLWYQQDDVAYYHLGAYSETGYQSRASFGLFWQAIHYFRESGVNWLNLGAGAGLAGDDQDGLSKFKQGWATGTRTAYLCGRVNNSEVYTDLTKRTHTENADYFPAYRSGEFS